MKQTWHDLLFAHWPVPHADLRRLVPEQLTLDTFDNQCWVGVVPFHMRAIRGRFLPPLPGLSRFPELNVRTYVTHSGKPGVYFFSLDAATLPAVWAARAFYHLPYFHADMSSEDRDGTIHYSSRRRDNPAEFRDAIAPSRLFNCATKVHSNTGCPNAIVSTPPFAIRCTAARFTISSGLCKTPKLNSKSTLSQPRPASLCPTLRLRYSLLADSRF